MVGCSDPAMVSTDGSLVAGVSQWGITIQSRATTPLYFAAFDRQTLGNTDWYPCVSATCPSLAAGGVTTIPFGQGGVNAHTKEIALYWWGLVPAPVSQWPHTGFQPDSVRSMIIVR
jgi:hypothetical protein